MKQVHTTKDYSLFKSIEGNRNKNLLHINRLKKSMSENYLFTTITVNEFYEVIDGNHRFDAIQELGLSLNYIICPGYGLTEVHILNQNSKTWNADDYLNGYCNLGYKDYLQFADFKEKYKLGFNETMALLTGSLNRYNEMFYKGEFKIKSMWYAVDLIEKILLIEPYYKGIRRRSFVYTMMSLSKNNNFSFAEFLQKLKLQPTSLQDCTSVEAYKALIEDIYNYHRREKVNLKF